MKNACKTHSSNTHPTRRRHFFSSNFSFLSRVSLSLSLSLFFSSRICFSSVFIFRICYVLSLLLLLFSLNSSPSDSCIVSTRPLTRYNIKSPTNTHAHNESESYKNVFSHVYAVRRVYVWYTCARMCLCMQCTNLGNEIAFFYHCMCSFVCVYGGWLVYVCIRYVRLTLSVSV